MGAEKKKAKQRTKQLKAMVKTEEKKKKYRKVNQEWKEGGILYTPLGQYVAPPTRRSRRTSATRWSMAEILEANALEITKELVLIGYLPELVGKPCTSCGTA